MKLQTAKALLKYAKQFIPSWRVLRKATAWYMQLINWKHIK